MGVVRGMKMVTPTSIPSLVLDVLEALKGEAVEMVAMVVFVVFVLCADIIGGVEEAEYFLFQRRVLRWPRGGTGVQGENPVAQDVW